MLGLLLIYWVGKTFYELAVKYNKPKWLYAILGPVSYYGGIWLTGLILVMLHENGTISIYGLSDLMFTLMCIPGGILICVAFYQLLKYQWAKAPSVEDEFGTIDQDFSDL